MRACRAFTSGKFGDVVHCMDVAKAVIDRYFEEVDDKPVVTTKIVDTDTVTYEVSGGGWFLFSYPEMSCIHVFSHRGSMGYPSSDFGAPADTYWVLQTFNPV